MATGEELIRAHYPESAIGGFSRHNGGIEFYARINALVDETSVVLDYGAGRGAQIDTDRVPYARHLKTLKGRVARLEGCDIDEAVLENPYLDAAKTFAPGEPLPYEDDTFDLIYSSWVLEHVDDPAQVAGEILRVLKPGGHFCAITPNKYGYISLASRLAGNANHTRLLKRVQPERLEHDVFPTHYRMNTRRALRRAFADAGEVVVYDSSWEPAYHFGKRWVFGAFKLLHKLTPQGLNTVLLVFVRK